MTYYLIQMETQQWVPVERESLAGFLDQIDNQLAARYSANNIYITPEGMVLSVCEAFEYTNYDI